MANRKTKPVVSTNTETGEVKEYYSLSEASIFVAQSRCCRMDTAKKGIKGSISNGNTAYGCTWKWKQVEL